MKRTRETIYYTHPDQRWNLSGCTGFDGEDNGKAQRVAQQRAEQKEALERQMEDKRKQKEMERLADQ